MNREIYYLNDNDEIVSAEEATHAIIRDEYSNGKVSEMFLDKDDIEVQVFVKPKKYIIYFDFDSSRITEDASRVIWEFLDDIKKIEKNYIINVKGHADRIGNKKYNQNLSKRRTETVKHYLVKNGISSDIIKVKWEGKSNPMIITNDNFKEELNRRVDLEIKIID